MLPAIIISSKWPSRGWIALVLSIMRMCVKGWPISPACSFMLMLDCLSTCCLLVCMFFYKSFGASFS